jgi:hypothetical protein
VIGETDGKRREADGGNHTQRDRDPVPPPPPARPFPRLFDQGLELVVLEPTLTRFDHDGATLASTMVWVKVQRDDQTDLHEQVAAEIRRAISDGEAAPGERLPPPRTSPP